MLRLDHWTFEGLVAEVSAQLIHSAPQIDSLSWQGQQAGDGKFSTREIQNLVFEIAMPWPLSILQQTVQPNLPWADEHFAERVGGMPLNPPPSAANWPFAQAGHEDHVNGFGKFSHTYPERMWPKYASRGHVHKPEDLHRGIRFDYGDLNDLVNLLVKDPGSRQAYLPIWFPEDTGAVDGQRVPCTLGYHFMIRRGRIHVTYLIRACDFLRHFRDDVYMTIRLTQWVREQLDKAGISVELGNMTMHVMSMHVFEKDMDIVRHQHAEHQATFQRAFNERMI